MDHTVRHKNSHSKAGVLLKFTQYGISPAGVVTPGSPEICGVRRVSAVPDGLAGWLDLKFAVSQIPDENQKAYRCLPFN